MTTRRTISVEIAVDDPITLSVSNGAQQLMQKLANIYEGKCHLGCKIMKIERITNIGMIQIAYPGPATANVPVTFIAETVQYDAGDIIVDFRPARILENRAYGNFRHGFASMVVSDDVPITPGSTIVVAKVVDTTYETTSPSIILRLVPYSHPKNFTVWEPTGDYEESDQSNEIARQIEALASEINKMDAESRKFFEGQFYPWQKKESLPFGAKEYNIIELSRRKSLPKYICMDRRSGYFSPIVYGYTDDKFPTDYVRGEGVSAVDVVILLLSEHLKSLRVLESCINTFDAKKRSSPEQLILWKSF